MEQRGTWPRLVPDVVLALVAVAFAALLTGRAKPALGTWAALAWGQYVWLVLLAVLIHRAHAVADAAGRRRAIVLGAGATLIAAVSLVAHRHDPWFWDAATTSARASLVRAGDGLVGSRERFSIFYYFVAVLQAVSGQSAAVIRLAVAAVGASGFVALGLLAARHGGRAAGLAAAVLAATSPALFALLHWLYIDMFLLAVCLWWLVACGRQVGRPTRTGIAGVILLAVAALLTKEYALIVLPVGVGLVWVQGRAAVPAGPRRPLLALAVVAGLGLAWGLWRVYLHFWRGIFAAGEPSWEYWPLIVVPGHPYLAAGEQVRLMFDFASQHWSQLAAVGLLGPAVLSLVEVPARRRAAGWVLLAGAAALVLWTFFQVAPANLNRYWLRSDALAWTAPALLAVLAALRLGGGVRFRVTRWQWLMIAGIGVSTVFFACLGKVTRINGDLTAALDWRYPLFSYTFAAVLAGEAVVRLLALGRRLGGAGPPLAALVPALLVAGNVVAGTGYVRQVALFTADQQRGVEDAVARVQAGGVTVHSTWPYYYPEVSETFDYGPFRWREQGVTLAFLGHLDERAESDDIALFDGLTGHTFVPLADREDVATYSGDVPYVSPLRPTVRRLASPTVYVVDLAAPHRLPPLAPLREHFARPRDETHAIRWYGLGAHEVWANGLTMRWSIAEKVRATVGAAAGPRFHLRLRARAARDVTEQTVTLRVNGHDLGALPIGQNWDVLVWDIPGEIVHAEALNELVFVPRVTATPASQQGQASRDRRQLGLAFDWLDVVIAREGD